jgi:hypothetical protein
MTKMGRPAYKPTPEMAKKVETLAGLGTHQDDIAIALGVSIPTVAKYYPKELKVGKVKANTAVAQSLYQKATGNESSAVTAAIFWAKTQMGWKETNATENQHRIIIEVRHFNEDDTPIVDLAANPLKRLNGH